MGYIITSFEQYKTTVLNEKFKMGNLFFYTFDDMQKDIINFAKSSHHDCLVSVDVESDTTSELHVVENDIEICDYLIEDDGEEFTIIDKLTNAIVAHLDTIHDVLRYIKLHLQALWTSNSKA